MNAKLAEGPRTNDVPREFFSSPLSVIPDFLIHPLEAEWNAYPENTSQRSNLLIRPVDQVFQLNSNTDYIASKPSGPLSPREKRELVIDFTAIRV